MENLILLIVAGFGAGVVTGLAGASAATIITPLLVAFGGFLSYTAITISLFTDVFASAVSAYTYKKNGNIKIKNGIALSIFAVIFSVFGSYLSSVIPDSALGNSSATITLFLGISFIVKSNKKKQQYLDPNYIELPPVQRFANHQLLVSIVFGSIIGLICGFVGAGGGMMILVILTAILGYDMKTAIGTSVLIMTFTAFSGGLAHVAHLDVPFPFRDIVITSIFAIIGAKIAAKFANSVPEFKLLRVVAITFIILAIILIVQKNFM